mmetsp:Transcript_5523/g.23400  ORF Transcript_5523/g.23400 Transcript_5523/m.23400 type:complete len:245 (+) Transcript_5523:1284-2018(+)
MLLASSSPMASAASLATARRRASIRCLFRAIQSSSSAFFDCRRGVGKALSVKRMGTLAGAPLDRGGGRNTMAGASEAGCFLLGDWAAAGDAADSAVMDAAPAGLAGASSGAPGSSPASGEVTAVAAAAAAAAGLADRPAAASACTRASASYTRASASSLASALRASSCSLSAFSSAICRRKARSEASCCRWRRALPSASSSLRRFSIEASRRSRKAALSRPSACSAGQAPSCCLGRLSTSMPSL